MDFLTQLLPVVFFGLVLGSFATALIYRIPRKLDWVSKRSFCTTCQNSLGPVDLVPVLSWLLSGGACRYCKTKISIKYPLIEISMAVLLLLTHVVFGFQPEFFFIAAALPLLLALFVIDMEEMILPNILVFLLAALGAGRLAYFTFFNSHASLNSMSFVTGAFAYAGLSWFLGWFLSKMLHKDSLGFGDVKFFFAAGLWLGLPVLPYFLMMSGLGGVLSAFLWRFIQKQELFPFGPSLIVSFYALLLFQGAFYI